jgi:hypothetical protein
MMLLLEKLLIKNSKNQRNFNVVENNVNEQLPLIENIDLSKMK